MTSSAPQRLTAAEYLAIERAAEQKSEFFAGEMFAMAGASREHNLIAANVTRVLGNQLMGRPCELYPGDMRVKVSPTGLYTYPDVAVVCDEPVFEDAQVDTLLNPTLIIEILSTTTEAYDRGGKFVHYQQIDSLQEYVLISQDQLRLERYVRQPGSQEWLLVGMSDAQGIVSLDSIGCKLASAEVYAKVKLPEGEGPLRQPYTRR
jgi:Uma2 family endonuclease